MARWDENQLRGILQHLGKEVARAHGAKERLEALKRMDSPEEFGPFVASLHNAHLDAPARAAAVDYVRDPAHFVERLAIVQRAASESYANRFSPSS